jgi:hypothetical protein
MVAVSNFSIMVASTANATAVWGLFGREIEIWGRLTKSSKQSSQQLAYKHGNIFLEILLGSIEGLSSNVLK